MLGKLPSLAGRIALPFMLLALAGCDRIELLDPKGPIGEQEKNLILIAVGLMLLVVVPVMALTVYFAWRYRESNTKATYAPKWSHSTGIEVVVWSIPCVIVLALAVLIWKTTHSLDPYKPLESQATPVNVEVVSLDWKWLFIYPDYGVASVNELAVPTGAPINFRLTSDSMMNSFFIPELGTQVYTMAGMQTQLHLVADQPGTYPGRSASFSGPGFSDMNFDTHAMSWDQFKAWVKQAKSAPAILDEATFKALEAPSEKTPPTIYASAVPGLFERIVDRFMAGRMPKTASLSGPICAPDESVSRRND
jgi:cytochrome o ubiquinol oxidase subunit 2